ncbi:hypothetical protein HU200_043984 [Digitaria exilis]|uniref:Leucine-rich repeat-containing N-terminal plant-type domain-containing protein n=1 Tax=Digitaria exilis TaxID=1010633 RepID=A0A835EBJ1_9POAL|nr:hypothetical protein HU200_043984 [Digitaria exilis]
MEPLHSSCPKRNSKILHINSLGVALVLLFLAPLASSCTDEERTSLLEFLDGLSQDSALNTSWKNGTNCCLWQGVICNVNGAVTDISLASMGLEGHISPSLGNLTGLLRVNLSGNSLSSELPSELLLSSSIIVLDVSFNKLNGELHGLPSTTERTIKVIDISSNLFTGYFPYNTLQSMKNLAALNMSNNSFIGKIPSTVCVDKQFFTIIDLSYNQFHGNIPPEVGNCSMLRVLKAGQNHLSGHLPTELFNVMSLEHLSFPNNNLQGTLHPEHVVRLSKLIILDLGGNRLNGKIPNSVGQLKRLEELHLSYNNMSGELPSALSNCSNLKTLILQGNNFQGNNKLIGVIPTEIGQLKGLLSLNLSFNNLYGEIPQSIGNLSNLQALDLSYNNLLGEIPYALERLHFLAKFNISNNDLEGPIPTGGQFSTFPDSSFAGNPRLCRPALMPYCNSADAAPVSIVSTKESIANFPFALAFGIFVGVGVLYDQMVLHRYIFLG